MHAQYHYISKLDQGVATQGQACSFLTTCLFPDASGPNNQSPLGKYPDGEFPFIVDIFCSLESASERYIASYQLDACHLDDEPGGG